MPRIRRIEIIVNGIHRTIGYIDYDKNTYFSKRDKKNLFRSFYGFGISVPVLDYLFNEGIENIVIIYNGQCFKTTLSQFTLKGFKHRDGRDFQEVLPLAYFDNAPEWADVPIQYDKPENKQLFTGYYSFKEKSPQLNLGVFM